MYSVSSPFSLLGEQKNLSYPFLPFVALLDDEKPRSDVQSLKRLLGDLGLDENVLIALQEETIDAEMVEGGPLTFDITIHT